MKIATDKIKTNKIEKKEEENKKKIEEKKFCYYVDGCNNVEDFFRFLFFIIPKKSQIHVITNTNQNLECFKNTHQ